MITETFIEKLQTIGGYFIEQASMDYNSIYFLGALSLFLVIYFLLHFQVLKEIWIAVGSVAFFCWTGWQAITIVFATAVITYIATRRIQSIYLTYSYLVEGRTAKEQGDILNQAKKKAKWPVRVALICIIGIWVAVKVCKYLGMPGVKSFAELANGTGIIVPLGISFYTLSAVGYILDVFWKKVEAEQDFFRLFSAMIYFPHIVQGPISHYKPLMDQMAKLPGFDYKRVCFGIQLLFWGLFKKTIVADRLVIYTQQVFADPTYFAGVEIVIAVILSVVYIYADFSGCMDIVRGISQIMGIELEMNFNQPFYAESAQEFWSRWHMTLSGWTKSYIYLPIAMNPKFMKWTRNLKKNGHAWFSSFIKAFVPLICVWLFTGLWHGTGVGYVIWGLYWCLMMTIGKETAPIRNWIYDKLHIKEDSRGHHIHCRIRTFILFAIGRMWTQCTSIAACGILCKQIFVESRIWTLFDGSLYTYGVTQKSFYMALAGILVMWYVDILHERGKHIREDVSRWILPLRWLMYYGLIFAVLVFGMYGAAVDTAAFAYGAF